MGRHRHKGLDGGKPPIARLTVPPPRQARRMRASPRCQAPAAAEPHIPINSLSVQDWSAAVRRRLSSTGAGLDDHRVSRQAPGRCQLPVELCYVRQVEPDHVAGMPRVRVVEQKSDTFAVADGAQALGHDIGVAERVGDAGFLVLDKVVASVSLASAWGRIAAGGDVAETLACGGAPAGWFDSTVSRGAGRGHLTSSAQRKPTTLLAPPRS